MKNICLYHRSDLDGHCSGAIVKHFVPDTELIGVEYGDDILKSDEFWAKLAGARVYLVDFSLQPWERMQQLAKIAGELVWVDHHRTAIDESGEKGWSEGAHPLQDPPHVTTILYDKEAACELAWRHFAKGLIDEVPHAVRLLGRYDVWDHAFDADVLPFQFGMRLEPTDPSNGDYEWEKVFAAEAEGSFHLEMVGKGNTILAYQTQCNTRLMGKAFDFFWEEKNLALLVVNAGGINSQAFDSKFNPDKHDAVMGFFYDGPNEKWTFSLYSPDQRYAKDTTLCGIAKELGGGGHPCACGFQVEHLSQVFGGRLSLIPQPAPA